MQRNNTPNYAIEINKFNREKHESFKATQKQRKEEQTRPHTQKHREKNGTNLVSDI